MAGSTTTSCSASRATSTSRRHGWTRSRRSRRFLLCSRFPMSSLSDLMTSDVLTVAPEDTIGEAAQKMVDREVSSAAVSDYGRLIGILTERDLTRAVAGRTHSSEARVREWMTPDPVTLPPTASPKEAAETMLERGFRHIPVIEGERAIGIVSIRDVARWSTEED